MAKVSCREDVAGRFGAKDIQQSRICAALAYLVFFIPLIIYPDHRFGRFHANQALILLVFSTIIVTTLMLLPYIGMFLAAPLAVFCLVCALRGAILALRRQAKRVPLIGRLEFIAWEPKA